MLGKRERIIEYISDLPAGTRLSVRALSRELNVSEGTAYKAIKCAEELHLVESKPRVGTVRLDHTVSEDSTGPMLAVVIQQLGLTVLAGREFTNVTIDRVVIGDGSLEQLSNSISDVKGNILCLVGDRPDILFYAASKGIHLVITAGSHPGEALLESAVKHKACVLSAEQDSAFVLGLLCSTTNFSYPTANAELAKDWMRDSPYLHYNDIVADWYSMYRPIFSSCSKCAVVDDELHICGTVDALKTLSSSPSRKISSLFSNDETCFTVDEDISVVNLADQMIARETAIAFITHNGMLSGIITSNDILRYYRYNSTAGITAPGLRLERSEKTEQHDRNIYTLQLPEQYRTTEETLFSAIISAARMHCSALSDKSWAFESGSFYVQSAASSGAVLVSCDTVKTISTGFVLDVEVYDETTTFARCLLTVTLSESMELMD